jgi:hypothetical protein
MKQNKESKYYQKTQDDLLAGSMVLFRKEVRRLLTGRRHVIGSWDDFIMNSIYAINHEFSFDIDYLSGASDYFMYELHNSNTRLTWTSYSKYYKRKQSLHGKDKEVLGLDQFMG